MCTVHNFIYFITDIIISRYTKIKQMAQLLGFNVMKTVTVKD